MTAITADNPLKGWYKFRRHREARWEPACIWEENGKLVCRIADRMVEPHEVWTYLAGNKVDKAAAQFAFKTGRFPDEPEAIPLSNLPSDPFEALKIEIEAQRSRAEEWLGTRPTIMTQVDCDLAVNLQKELLALNKRAESMFKAEKAPLLEATRACDAKYNFRATVADVAERLRKVFGRFMAEEEGRQKADAAAKHKAEVERIAAERAKKLANDPVAALTEAAPELPLAPEPVHVTAGGGVGRKAGLRTVWIGVIDDYEKALAHYAEHPDIRAAVEKRVAHDVRDSKGTAKIAGVTIKEERRAA